MRERGERGREGGRGGLEKGERERGEREREREEREGKKVFFFYFAHRANLRFLDRLERSGVIS